MAVLQSTARAREARIGKHGIADAALAAMLARDRKRVVEGKRVDLGGRRIITAPAKKEGG